MYAKALSATIRGMDVIPIQVEVDASDGLPAYTMVGLPSTQVRESLDRVRTAFKNNGFYLPPKRVTINLAPADVPKERGGFDLPVAAGILAAMQLIPAAYLDQVMMMGELSLNGGIRRVSGVLPAVLKAREMGLRLCVIPYDNLKEGRLIQGIPVIGVKNISEVVNVLASPEEYLSDETDIICQPDQTAKEVDFFEIYGQNNIRRAAEIAVSGFHNLLMIGPPGAGKTMIARRIPTIMPDLTFEEQLEITKIYSIAGLLSPDNPYIMHRPFRSPHHTSTVQALAGGGTNPRPGEITLAHRGVLFLDEMPEFTRKSLEALRQPLEDKIIHIARASGSFEFPADFILIAAMNPCPCGNYPDMNRCRCTPAQIMQYMGKISQPLLDRIDLSTEVSPVRYEEMKAIKVSEDSESIRKRVTAAASIQNERYKGEHFRFNGDLTGSKIARYCVTTDEGERLLKSAFENSGLSMRGYNRILKVARTIADMDGSEHIDSSHIGEALAYRAFDKSSMHL